MTKDIQLVFVGGAPRSGTTLVQHVLDSHPLVYAGPEFNYLPYFLEFRDLLAHGVKSKSIDKFYQHQNVNSQIADLLRQTFAGTATHNGCKIFCEKTPSNALYFDELHKLFPEAKFIFVRRSPLSILASLKQVKQRYKTKLGRLPLDYTRNVPSSVEFVKKCLEKGLSFVKGHPERSILIDYEKLVENPKEATKYLCEFLNIDWSSKMLEPKKHAKSSTDQNEFNGIWYDEKMFFRNIDKKSLNNWKGKLRKREIHYISKHLSEYKNIFPVLEMNLGKLSFSPILSIQFLILKAREAIFGSKSINRFLSLAYNYSKSTVKKRT